MHLTRTRGMPVELVESYRYLCT